MSNRIKEAFMLDEFEMELQKSGAYYDEPEKVLKQYSGVRNISDLDEMYSITHEKKLLAY